MPNIEKTNTLQGAQWWMNFGLFPIPLYKGTKTPVIKYVGKDRPTDFSQVAYHWQNGDYDIAVLLNQDVLVLDADSPESYQAIQELEREFNLHSNIVVKTKKGWHFYYQLPSGLTVKTKTYCSKEHPKRIDVKSSNGYMIVPPSSDKSFEIKEADSIMGLTLAKKQFVDSVLRHNGVKPNQTKPSGMPLPAVITKDKIIKNTDLLIERIEKLLKFISPDCGYEDWSHNVGMVIYQETGGSDEGFNVWNSWSSKGEKYKGKTALLTHWKSFSLEHPNPRTLGSLIQLAKDQGASQYQIDVALGRAFEVLEQKTIVIHESSETSRIQLNSDNTKSSTEQQKLSGLEKYSLIGKSSALASELSSQTFALPSLAIVGKLTSTNNRLKAQHAKAQKTVAKRSQHVARRIKKVVMAGMARAPVEAVPFVGVPVLFGGIAYEVSMGCQNLNDINQMLLSVGSEPQDGITHKVCQAELPTLDEFKAMIN